jgi:chemotaxis signal transduction protein
VQAKKICSENDKNGLLQVHSKEWNLINPDARLIGIRVDTVFDILSVDTSEINPAPKMGSQIDEEYLTGLVTVNERMVALLDSIKLFSEEQLEQGLITVNAAAN